MGNIITKSFKLQSNPQTLEVLKSKQIQDSPKLSSSETKAQNSEDFENFKFEKFLINQLKSIVLLKPELQQKELLSIRLNLEKYSQIVINILNNPLVEAVVKKSLVDLIVLKDQTFGRKILSELILQKNIYSYILQDDKRLDYIAKDVDLKRYMIEAMLLFSDQDSVFSLLVKIKNQTDQKEIYDQIQDIQQNIYWPQLKNNTLIQNDANMVK